MATHIIIPGQTNLDLPGTYFDGIDPATWTAGDKVHCLDGEQELTGGTAVVVALNEVFFGPRQRVKCYNLPWAVTNGTNPRLKIYGYGGEIWSSGNCSFVEVQGSQAYKAIGGTIPALFAMQASYHIASAADLQGLEALFSGGEIESHGSERLDTFTLVGGTLDISRDLIVGDLSEGARLILRGAADITDGAGGGKVRTRSRKDIIDIQNAATIDELKGYAGQLRTQEATGNVTVTLARLATAFNLQKYFPNGSVTTTTLTSLGTPSLGGIGGAL